MFFWLQPITSQILRSAPPFGPVVVITLNVNENKMAAKRDFDLKLIELGKQTPIL